jgi:glutamate synthase (NADPH) small chain
MDGGYFKLRYSPPPTMPVELRVQVFAQVLQYFPEAEAAIQAKRCISCDVPGCNTGCGVGQDVPGFLHAAGEERWLEAHRISVRSPLYGLLGQICPQQTGLCESQCTVGYLGLLGQKDIGQQKLRDTIAIGGVESTIWRHAIDNGWLSYAKPTAETNRSVAVVGAGPAGIFLALDQRRVGNHVTVFDRWSEVGGLLFQGIPDFKLEKRDLPFVRAAMEETGIKFQMNSLIGNGSESRTTLRDLLANYDAVVLATGTYAARKIINPGTGLPIDGHEHLINGLDYLFAHNKNIRAGTTVPRELQVKDRHVIVIGPGDTGQDCIRTALRAGAGHVTVLCRNPPRGALKERIHADEEQAWLRQNGMGGIDYELRVSLSKVVQLPGGALELQMRRGDGKPHSIVADKIINATGFDKEDLGNKYGIPGLQVNERQGRGQIIRDGSTTVRNLFVAGDALTGSTLAVHAGQSGRYVSGTVHRFLRASMGTPAV